MDKTEANIDSDGLPRKKFEEEVYCLLFIALMQENFKP